MESTLSFFAVSNRIKVLKALDTAKAQQATRESEIIMDQQFKSLFA